MCPLSGESCGQQRLRVVKRSDEPGDTNALNALPTLTLTDAQPRAIGSVALKVTASDRGTEIARLRHEGSIRALFPRRDRSRLTAVLVNTAGGVTGGDRFSVRVEAGEGADVTITTQAAERAYRAQPGQTGRIDTVLTIGPKARVAWLPQETILFDGSSLERRLTVDLGTGASALIVEPLIFGRRAMNEHVSSATLSDRITLRRDGVSIYLDRICMTGDLVARMSRPATGQGSAATSTVLFAGEGAEAKLAAARAILPETAGISLVRPGLLAARLLAEDGFELRRALLPLIRLLADDDLPRPWMI